MLWSLQRIERTICCTTHFKNNTILLKINIIAVITFISVFTLAVPICIWWMNHSFRKRKVKKNYRNSLGMVLFVTGIQYWLAELSWIMINSWSIRLTSGHRNKLPIIWLGFLLNLSFSSPWVMEPPEPAFLFLRWWLMWPSRAAVFPEQWKHSRPGGEKDLGLVMYNKDFLCFDIGVFP